MLSFKYKTIVQFQNIINEDLKICFQYIIKYVIKFL